MPTDIAQSYPHSQARNFALRGLAWTLGLFGLIRLGWFETHAVLPVTLFQAQLAALSFGAPGRAIDVTVACSGADALALCLGAVLAYPAARSMRMAGAAGGVVLILVLNTIRIGMLGRAAETPWFETLHLYVWPAVLMLVIAVYVFGWMRFADTRPIAAAAAIRHDVVPVIRRPWLTRRFAWTAAVLVTVFTVASPLYFESAIVLAAASFVARATAAALRVLGIQADASGNVLATSRGTFLVTQECIATPLIPVYCAAVFAGVRTVTHRVAALVLVVPLFLALGMARLLVVALPAVLVGSPLFLIHAFYQILTGATLICVAAVWRSEFSLTAVTRALSGCLAGALICYVTIPAYGWMMPAGFIAAVGDAQGAVTFLPAFQAALFVALGVALFPSVRGRLAAAGFAVLALLQIATCAALLLAAGQGFVPGVTVIRAWALLAPLLVTLAIVKYELARR